MTQGGRHQAGIAGAGQQVVQAGERAPTRGLQVRQPPFSQHLEATPALVRAQRHGEDVTKFAVQVGQAALRVVDDAQQHRLDPGAGAGDHLARGVVEVQVPEGGEVLDLVAANLQLLQTITRGNGALGGSLGPGLTVHALGAQITPHRRVRGHRHECAVWLAGLASQAQLVQVQPRGPARMLAVLQRQCRNGHRRQAGEAAHVATQRPLRGLRPSITFRGDRQSSSMQAPGLPHRRCGLLESRLWSLVVPGYVHLLQVLIQPRAT